VTYASGSENLSQYIVTQYPPPQLGVTRGVWGQSHFGVRVKLTLTPK
jgi:hypothetical protein